MTSPTSIEYIAFAQHKEIASGDLLKVTSRVKQRLEASQIESALVFKSTNGRIKDLDLRGSLKQTQAWARAQMKEEECLAGVEGKTNNAASRGRGRPKLGVVSREVTLLPRHWAWLSAQRGGASAELRRLVDRARKLGEGPERMRESRDATYRFISAIGGDLPNFEEATRALFSGDADKFNSQIEEWPKDIVRFCLHLAEKAFVLPDNLETGDAERLPEQ